MGSPLALLNEKLRDSRGRRILVVAHCVLNENARVQGGAFHPGGDDGIIDQAQRAGVGIVQLPCPEQASWGGVQRPRMWVMLGKKGTLLYRLRRPFLTAFRWQTKRVQRRLARDAVRVLRDFAENGYEIVGIVGIGGSPTCGVTRRLDLSRAVEYVAGVAPERLVRDTFNRECARAGVVPGEGWFVQELRRELRRWRLDVPFFESDVVAEMEGHPRPLELRLS